MATIPSLLESARLLVRPKRPEASYPARPMVRPDGSTRVPGLYIAGELAGAALIKTSLHQGMDAAEAAASRKGTGGAEWDLVVCGTGAAGYAALVRARELGLRALGLDAGRFAQSIHAFTRGKILYAEPLDEPLRSSAWFEECPKEVLLQRWAEQRQRLGIDVHEFEPVTDVRREKDGALTVETSRGQYRAAAVLIAIGKSGQPRKAGVPGEDRFPARILHRLADPEVFQDQDIVIYGGGDVAVEAALALAPHNRVTLATINPRWLRPRQRNIDQIEGERARGRVEVLFNTRLLSIGEKSVLLEDQSTGRSVKKPAAAVFEMIGADLPRDLLKRIGLRLEGEWTPLRWLGLAAALLLTFSLYSFKAHRWPFAGFDLAAWAAGHPLFHWLLHVPRGISPADVPAFWYTALYTLFVVGFGLPAARRWGRHDSYQRWRYASYLSFQVGFFLIVNFGLARLMPKYYWRGWGLYQPFPLFYNTFFWWYPGDPATIKWFFIGFGLLLTFVIIPLFVRRHGMRFCTWICGCGAMAETFGDRWRHLSPKGLRSRLWEFQGPLIAVWAFLSMFVIVFAYHTDGGNGSWHWYSYLVDFWLVAVIPIGLYPFFGGKVWCRYWCPLAHYMKWLSRMFGRLEIKANDHCIQCGECSRYCQVGVDVMAFARNGESFDNTNSSCIHCGICITVCPMDVLSFNVKGQEQKQLVQIANAAVVRGKE